MPREVWPTIHRTTRSSTFAYWAGSSSVRAQPFCGLSRHAESLLAYLLLHREVPLPRPDLAFLLWPDSTERQARTNLRHLLHNLRRALPHLDRFLEVSPRTVQWRADAPFWLDIAAFEQAVRQAAVESRR